jgi:hypothetical protein
MKAKRQAGRNDSQGEPTRLVENSIFQPRKH